MKVSKSQIFIGIVCAILGFLLANQFKVLYNKNNLNLNTANKNDIMQEIESLKKEKEELVKSNNDLSAKLKSVEESATDSGDVGKQIKNQLDVSRMQLGTEDVKGSGVIMTVSPKSSIFSGSQDSSGRDLGEDEIVHLANILWFSGAEAVSINDIRLTAQTGIKTAGNGISIGLQGKIYPREKIEFKAIGDKGKLNAGIQFYGSLDYGALVNYNVDYKSIDEIEIGKSTQSLKNDYIKPIEK